MFGGLTLPPPSDERSSLNSMAVGSAAAFILPRVAPSSAWICRREEAFSGKFFSYIIHTHTHIHNGDESITNLSLWHLKKL